MSKENTGASQTQLLLQTHSFIREPFARFKYIKIGINHKRISVEKKTDNNKHQQFIPN